MRAAQSRNHFSAAKVKIHSGERAVPEFFNLHASGITPAVELEVTGLAEAAAKESFDVVLPGHHLECPTSDLTTLPLTTQTSGIGASCPCRQPA